MKLKNEKEERKENKKEKENSLIVKAKIESKLPVNKPTKDLFSIFNEANAKKTPIVDSETAKIVPKNNNRCLIPKTDERKKPTVRYKSKHLTVTKDIRYRINPSLEKQIKINQMFKPTNQLEDRLPDH